MKAQQLVTGLAVLALAGTTLSTVPASAADIVPVVSPIVVAPPPPPPPPRTWTGGYVGGHAGLLRGTLHDGTSCLGDFGDELPAFYLVGFPGSTTFPGGSCFDHLGAGTVDGFFGFPFTQTEVEPLRGFFAGVQIGYHRQLGGGPNGFVIGAEVAHSRTSAQAFIHSGEGLVPAAVAPNQIEGGAGTGLFELHGLTTATLHAGFGTPQFLVYGLVGLALAETTYNTDWGYVMQS
jgi:opacity protein-like surface antigen